MFKVTVSGSYRTGSGKGSEIVDFENVTGVMPECAEELIQSNVMRRMLPIWIKADKKYTQRYDMVRTCYIDKVETIKGQPGIVGKDVKELAWEELQELMVWKNLRKIPTFRSTDLRIAREIAYLEYSKLLGKEINTKAKGYNYVNLPALVIKDDGKIAATPETKTNEEVLQGEQENTGVATGSGPDKTFTLAELKQIAKDKGIKLPANISYARAFELVIKDQK